MKKIYVTCPAFLATGGTELLHQLVNSLNQFSNFKSYLFYCNYDVSKEVPVIPEKFTKYVREDELANSIEDLAENILIVPEVLTSLLPNYKAIKKVIWWLSVDNFYEANQYPQLTFKTTFNYYLRKTFGVRPNHYQQLHFNKKYVDFHLYQSEYARLFLEQRGMKNLLPLSDYLNDEFFQHVSKDKPKENIIAYNPAKGLEFTSKLIEEGKDLNWVPIRKMTPAEVADLLAVAKVYIDFGAHPGKDRIPREAAIKGCCVITGRNGAAANSVDVPIPDKYKFDKDEANIPAVLSLIRKVFENFPPHHAAFQSYREFIKADKVRFEDDLKNFLRAAGFLP